MRKCFLPTHMPTLCLGIYIKESMFYYRGNCTSMFAVDLLEAGVRNSPSTIELKLKCWIEIYILLHTTVGRC